jgi:hypothetical protein
MSEEEKLEERLAVRLSRADKQAFVDKVREDGRTVSQVLLHLVREYINGEDKGDERIARLEEEIALIKKRLGELPASEMKIAS